MVVLRELNWGLCKTLSDSVGLCYLLQLAQCGCWPFEVSKNSRSLLAFVAEDRGCTLVRQMGMLNGGPKNRIGND